MLNFCKKLLCIFDSKETVEVKKRLEEVRLLESRRSARLADQERDTNFARLADMSGDRRKTSHSIDVPLPTIPEHNMRKRAHLEPPDFAVECKEEELSECNAALILMNLHNSPNGGGKYLAPKKIRMGDLNPKQTAENFFLLDKRIDSSPGSWSSGSASPPLSDDGHILLHGHMIMQNGVSASARMRTTSVSTSDEGIVLDFKEERKKKSRKFRCTWKGCNFIEQTQPRIERHIRSKHLGKKTQRSADCDSYSENEHEEEFYYTEEDDDDDQEFAKMTPSPASPPTLSHRDMARPPHEDPEYQRQIVGNFKQGRATNYYYQQQQQQQQQQNTQQQIVYNQGRNTMHHNLTNNNNNNNNNSISNITSGQQQQLVNNNTSCIPTSPLAHHNYTWPSTGAVTVTATSTTTTAMPNGPTQYQINHQQQPHSPVVATLVKHPRTSPRPSHLAAPYPSPTYVHQHHNKYNSNNNNNNNSGNTSSSGHINSNGNGNSNGNSISVSGIVSNGNVYVNNGSPLTIHNNSSANNVLQQLTQQNVTVTAHHNVYSNNMQHQQQQPQQQQQQLAAITITPNYQIPQQPQQIICGTIQQQPQQAPQQSQQPQQQTQLQQQQQPYATTANNNTNNNNSQPRFNAQTKQNVTPVKRVGKQAASVTGLTSPSAAAAAAGAAATKRAPYSTNRRTRGENKKCRKFYGMVNRDDWCLQCKWKKACTRFAA